MSYTLSTNGRGVSRLFINALLMIGGFNLAIAWLAPKATSTEVASALTNSAIAAPTATSGDVLSMQPDSLTDSSSESDASMSQVTSVSQLTDVKPTDWAFQALEALVQRYGCISGYPDRKFRGNQAVTRYEFAAGLNACMEQAVALISSKEDIATLKKLQEDFAAELATLRGRVDSLEARTATLEKQQFSTTTKLFGQVIFGVQGRTKNQVAPFLNTKVDDTDTQINVISNAQLSLFTQLSPRSILLTGLQAGSGRTGQSLINDAVALAYEGDTSSSLIISDLSYRQLIGDSFAVIAGPAGVNMVNVFRGPNRVEGAGSGPISLFAQRNPILNIGFGNSGAGFDWQITPNISLQSVYSAATANVPTTNSGIFNGGTNVGVQLNIAPTQKIDIALSYVHAYSPTGFLGRIGLPVGDNQVSVAGPLKTNAIGGAISWRVIPKLTLGGWVGYTSSFIPDFNGSVETINWMAYLNFPDLGGRGNLGGIYVGQPPKIYSSDLPTGTNVPNILAGGIGTAGGQPGTTTHVEAFYRLQVSDNISITPGFIVLFNRGNNPVNDTVLIGALRTTFSF